MSVTVIVPVLNRPERVEPLMASLISSSKSVALRVMFVCNEDDEAEREALEAHPEIDAVMVMQGGREPGDYARKINRAYQAVMLDSFHRSDDSDWVFLGADDLCFCPGWADAALAHQLEGIDVVGTNDLGNPLVKSGQHSTHSLVRVGYIGTIDNPGQLLHEGYRHNWVDTEFVQTAKRRGVFFHATDSWVEHLHPHWGFGQYDATYNLGLADFEADGQLYRKRQRLWA